MRLFVKKARDNRQKKGFSLMEAVIALSLITIISISMISLLLAAGKVEIKTFETQQYYNLAENAVECFRYADGDADTFLTVVNATLREGSSLYEYREDTKAGDTCRTYILTKNGEDLSSLRITIEGQEMIVYITLSDGDTPDPIVYRLGGGWYA